MKQIILLALIGLLVIPAFSQQAWQERGVKFPAPICYGSNVSHASCVHAPEEHSLRLKSAAQKRSSIVVSYIGFEEEPKAAFQHAVEIWESIINSPVPIHLTARWTKLDEDVLGSCGPYEYYENFDAAPYKNCYYPVALVEKLEGKEISGEDVPDIIAQFNSANENWYFGTDGQTPAGKYDFVSVVLHEIGHGLGFTGFFYEQNDQGIYGNILPYPAIFDELVINRLGNYLVDTNLYPNPSSDLLRQFRSNSLYSKSEAARLQSASNSYPRLFAPSTFDEGSSIYHLNESTYLNGNVNSLMTPYFDMAEAVHDPGPYTLGIFADMGWVYTNITHEPLKDVEEAELLVVDATINTDTEIDSSSVAFIFSGDGFETVDTLQVSYNEDLQKFHLSLANFVGGNYDYYLTVEDTSGRSFYLPARAPRTSFSFKIGDDLEAPLVAHRQIPLLFEDDLAAEVLVEAMDNVGVKEVKMRYLVNDDEPKELVLKALGDDLFRDTLRLEGLVDGDSVRYQIVVEDSSTNANQTILPEVDGYYSFMIDGYYEPVELYVNDFNSTTRDFSSADFYIGEEELFETGALHSPHPYPSPNIDGETFDLITTLKYPIIINEQGTISFREVVLVEPGEPGTTYGDDNFWDYVIVEASKNGTGEWLPLIDGYDSKNNSTWLSSYNSLIEGNNSTANGKESYYIDRIFKLTDSGHYQKGDTIIIRFRLFSDPYANGWGWAIDDLKIQDPSTAVDLVDFSPGELLVYPNPAAEKLFVKGSFKLKAETVKLSILSTQGQLLKQELFGGVAQELYKEIDVQNLGSGLYLVVFEFENGQVFTQKFVKQ